MTTTLRAITLLAMACSTAGVGVAETKPAVIEGWGRVVDPDLDCTVKADNGRLSITIPGTHHNLNPDVGTNAPRVLRQVEGDFTATVKVTSDFRPGQGSTIPGGYPFNGAGLLIWADGRNYLRLERNVWWVPEAGRHACYPPLVEYYRDGVYQDTNPRGTAAEFFKGRSTYLRLGRKGATVTAWYSHDGKEWTVAREVAVELPKKVWAGVAAVNSSDKPFAVEFEELEVAAGK